MAFVVGNVNVGSRSQATRAVSARRGNVRMMAEKEKLPKDKPAETPKAEAFEAPKPKAISKDTRTFPMAPAGTIPVAITTLEEQVPKPIEPFVRTRRDGYTNFDIPKLIAQVNKLMFGPAFVPAFEKSNLSEGESYIRGGNMSIKDYIKFVAKSPAWRSRFWDNRPSNYSAIEVCYRKFYGTTPDTKAEMLARSDLYHSGGYEAFIESFFDEKYDELWGDWMVPEWQNAATTDARKTMADYTDLFDIERGASASADVALTRKRSPTDSGKMNAAPPGTFPEAIPTIEFQVPKQIEPFVRSRRANTVPYDFPALIASVNSLMFGNALVTKFDAGCLVEGESYVRGGNMTIKEYIKFVAKSSYWKARFFDERPLYSCVEVCYRKFYGCTPKTAADSLAKSDVYYTDGYEGFIDSFFDEMYDELWGDWGVPEWQNESTLEKNLTMANYVDLFDIVRGPTASADVALTRKKSPASGKFTDFNLKTGCAPTRFGVSGTQVRIEIKGLTQRAQAGKPGSKGKGAVYPTRTSYSKFARTNTSVIVPFDQFTKKYTEIVKNGGRVVNVTTV